ncbi:hypothetical protein CDO73_08645 [Saccharibacillus sp. O23]|uniref:hypothetical protein n=1 Tax=Saccharibacillus sp. O23 TaxID=2009338 RepID=UPI000B4E39FF|nr:hypothetical protein [Saccharibacillus sp. O23]OWR31192.1 hypothetical protein CDO73_08645 [Saccharibacillus sp. O23]
MEKVSFSGGSSASWASDYRNPNTVNPDQTAKTSTTEKPKSDPKTEKDDKATDSVGEKQAVSAAERKKQDVEQAKKQEEEKQAQQKLLQTFYSEKLRIDMSPDKFKDSMKALAERSIEQLMSREGTSLKMEWKSELHKISLEISVEAYDKLSEQHDQNEQDKNLVETVKA